MPDCTLEQTTLDTAILALTPLLNSYLIDEAAVQEAQSTLDAAQADLLISDHELADGITAVLDAEIALEQCLAQTDPEDIVNMGASQEEDKNKERKLISKFLKVIRNSSPKDSQKK